MHTAQCAASKHRRVGERKCWVFICHSARSCWARFRLSLRFELKVGSPLSQFNLDREYPPVLTVYNLDAGKMQTEMTGDNRVFRLQPTQGCHQIARQPQRHGNRVTWPLAVLFAWRFANKNEKTLIDKTVTTMQRHPTTDTVSVSQCWIVTREEFHVFFLNGIFYFPV